MSLEQSADVQETVIGAYWFHVLGVCVHLVISGELASEERLRAAEYGLAIAVATTWHGSHVPDALRASETRRGGVAWAATTETLRKYSVTLFALIVELSRLTRPVRGSVFGTVPAEHSFSLVRGLSGTDQGVESLDRSFEWAILRALYRHNLRLRARLDHGRKRELCEDVPFFPLPADVAHVPFAAVQSQVQGAMVATGVSLSPIDGLPPLDEGSPFFLHDIGESACRFPLGGSFYADRAVRVHGCPEPAAVLDIGHTNR
jgi:hypothetical protein